MMGIERTEFTQFKHGLEIKTNSEQIELFNTLMQQSMPYEALFEAFDDLDVLAECAGFALSQGFISDEQLSTLLQFCNLKQESLNLQLVPIFNDQMELTKKAESIIERLVLPEDREEFLGQLKLKPISEHYFYKVTLPNPKNERINGLLMLADKHGIIRTKSTMIMRPGMSETEANEQADEIKIMGFSAGARHAILTVNNGIHCKASIPMPGIISINEINDCMMMGKRPLSVAYPGIQRESTFHRIVAGQFYLSLHDELHRTLISSIPNPIYSAYLAAISLVREKTGIKWSKELWDAVDMEIDIFMDQSRRQRENLSPEEITRGFLDVLNVQIASEFRPTALFSATSLNDTMWILLLDLYFNKASWLERGIDIRYFSQHYVYKEYYDLIEREGPGLENLSLAEQIVVLKYTSLNLPVPATAQALFVKKNREQGNYIQVEVDGKPIIASKEQAVRFIETLLETVSLFSNTSENISLFKDIILKDPVSFRAYIDYSLLYKLREIFRQQMDEYYHAYDQAIQSSKETFNAFINDMSELSIVLDTFKMHQEGILDTLETYKLSSLSGFMNFFHTIRHLSTLCKGYPKHEHRFLKLFEHYIFQPKHIDAGFLAIYISNLDDIQMLGYYFPQREQEICEAAMKIFPAEFANVKPQFFLKRSSHSSSSARSSQSRDAFFQNESSESAQPGTSNEKPQLKS